MPNTNAEWDRMYRDTIQTMGTFTGQPKGDKTNVSKSVDIIIDDIERWLAYFDNWSCSINCKLITFFIYLFTYQEKHR